jgi:hypothetical protein
MENKKTAQDLLRELIGQDLKDYKIVEMSEVVQVNEEGIRTGSIGFFKDARRAG